jgi:hypothetical protein
MKPENQMLVWNKIIRIFFLAMFNLLLMSITGYLTMDVYANGNSRIGAYLLSFFIPAFIVFKTTDLAPIKRLLYFGTGYAVHIILSLVIVGLPLTFTTHLGPCLVISLATLYFGNVLFVKLPAAEQVHHPAT